MSSTALVALDAPRQFTAKDEPSDALNPEHSGLWKKREIVINERITEYTKVDQNGVVQNLVESEKSQTEVVHIESKDGYFAHKEQTQFEQSEKFNSEVVMHEMGTEQFIHMKSKDDEFSHFESNMPPREGAEEGDPNGPGGEGPPGDPNGPGGEGGGGPHDQGGGPGPHEQDGPGDPYQQFPDGEGPEEPPASQ
jgi:terminal uridylyltransferase